MRVLVGWLVWLCVMPLWAAPERASLPLDEAQQAWLAEHPRLRVGVVLQAPYAEFKRRQLTLVGLNVELVDALAQQLPVQLSWRSYPDQAALEAALRAGKVDLAPGLSQTPASLRLWLFSDPYLRVPHLSLIHI